MNKCELKSQKKYIHMYMDLNLTYDKDRKSTESELVYSEKRYKTSRDNRKQ